MRALALLLLLPAPAYANGLTTHVYITLTARSHLPPGELADLVNDPTLEDALISGTIFPDGGYAVGDGYGELAHWEPFQLTYLDWIAETYPRPWSSEAREHIAFLLGMASHGMADQTFDSLYLTRARVYDEASRWAEDSVDEATDVLVAAEVGGQPVPDRFLPRETLVEIFDRAHGHAVDIDTLKRGQSLAGFAVAAVEILAADPEARADYRRQFPWATAHLFDPIVPGTPPDEAVLVARYWQRIWARLHGGLPADDFVMATRPRTGAFGHEVSAASIESRISLVFSRRLARAELEEARITLAGERPVPIGVELFYGDDSHVVHLIPAEDLAPDQTYTVTVEPGLTTREGDVLPAAYQLTLSTGAAPEAPNGCRCTGETAGPGSLLLLLAPLLVIRKRTPALLFLALAACKGEPKSDEPRDLPPPARERSEAPDVPYDCGFIAVEAPGCVPSPPWLADLERLGATFIEPRETPPTAEECRLASSALDRLLATDPASLTAMERIVAQNAALRIVGPRTCGPAFEGLSAKAARAVGHAALPRGVLSSLGDDPMPDLTEWIGPASGWKDRRSENAPLFHDTMEFFTRAFRPVRSDGTLAVFSQLVAVDTAWQVDVTPVVGRIELREDAESDAAACIGKLDVGRLRCGGGRIVPVPEAKLPANVFVRRTAPGRVDCNRCHGSEETDSNLSDLLDPTLHLDERRQRFLDDAQRGVDAVKRKAVGEKG